MRYNYYKVKNLEQRCCLNILWRKNNIRLRENPAQLMEK